LPLFINPVSQCLSVTVTFLAPWYGHFVCSTQQADCISVAIEISLDQGGKVRDEVQYQK
jgi:hypothetical protein